MRITDLARNDVPGALRFLEERLDQERFTSDDGQTLFALQDDPRELAAEVKKLVTERRRAGKPLGPFK